jgi:hypothetical protein
MDLVTDSKKFDNQKLTEATGEYFIGFLLMPWIWAWGLLILEGVLISYYNFQPKAVTNEFNLLQIFRSKVDLNSIFLAVFLFLLGNYSIAFITRKQVPKLNSLLFCLSLFSLCILFTFIWPHFLTVLNSN